MNTCKILILKDLDFEKITCYNIGASRVDVFFFVSSFNLIILYHRYIYISSVFYRYIYVQHCAQFTANYRYIYCAIYTNLIFIGLSIYDIMVLYKTNQYREGEMASDAQKKAFKKYNTKSIILSCSYRPGTDIQEGERVKDYLAETGQSANAYIKKLIKDDLDKKGFMMDIPEDDKDK